MNVILVNKTNISVDLKFLKVRLFSFKISESFKNELIYKNVKLNVFFFPFAETFDELLKKRTNDFLVISELG